MSIVVLLTSCYKTNPDDISDTIFWNPDISIPLGDTYATSKENENPQDKKQLLDTLVFKLSDIVNSRSEVDSMTIRLNIENEFPIQWNMFVFYVKEGDEITDYDNSLTGTTPIRVGAGKVDPNTGEITIPNKMIPYDIPLKPEQIDKLYFSDLLVVRLDSIKAVNPVDENIEYKFKTQIALQAKLNMAYD
jgi:hypothetical protein